ncbi:hypothetical protein [Pseudescherichia vulneris]|uniref:hypothetical protein n=1 Tax=Pseudescherichia vulneris TaxID=566 RepID=UPI003AF41524
MNRCLSLNLLLSLPLNLPRRSGVHAFPATRQSTLQTCRCYTHFGASQDSRAGYVW